METKLDQLKTKTVLLKEARLQLLRLHKSLVDVERELYEQENGKVGSGQFLSLLLSNAEFQWLRKFSILIVEIDEMLDLNDGFSIEMIDQHLSQMLKIIDLKTADEEFNEKYLIRLKNYLEIAGKNTELKNLLSE